MSVHTVYGREHVALPTAAEATALDREAREAGGIPERVLMENAGRAAALLIARHHPDGPVLGVAGSGNNGGDALVAVRTLRAWGREVALIAAGSSELEWALGHEFEVPRVERGDAVKAFAEAGVIVDGILGTGATGAPREPAATLIRQMNESGRPIAALDNPSGVDPTTGEVPGIAVRAHATVTFGWPKQGLLFEPGRSCCGRIVSVEIGFPPRAADSLSAAAITPAWAAARLPDRAPGAHKGSVGHVLVLAGRTGMGGAAAIAGRAAVRAGAGLVRIASVDANRTMLQSAVPEALFIDRADGAALEEAAAASDAIMAGPGIGTDDAGQRALDTVLSASGSGPCILDADAITILARRPAALAELGGGRPVVLTPHPGEMSRIVDLDIDGIRGRPIDTARQVAEDTGCVVLLKGAPSVVAAPGLAVLVNTTGSSDQATAGMGDQLSGMIGAFLANGAPPREAAALGLFYGGLAAERAGRGRALTPDDVSDHLHHVLGAGPAADAGRFPFITFDQPPRW